MSERIFAQIYGEIEAIKRRLDETRESVAFQHVGSGAPSHEASEGVFYWDYTNNNLYVNTDGATTWQAIGGSTGGAHTMLSATHTDSTAAAITRGALIIGLGASPTWTRRDHPSDPNQYLRSNAADPNWTADLTLGPTHYIGIDSSTNLQFASDSRVYLDVDGIRFLDFYEDNPILNYIGVGADVRMSGKTLYLDADNDTNIYAPSDDTVQVVVAGKTTFQFDDSFFVNDTANTKSQIGITVHQGTNDDEILSVKSSDVTHTLTLQTEADTYGYFNKYEGTSGGLRITGIKSSAGTNAHALRLRGFLDEAPQTTKATNAYGVMTFGVWEGDGANDVQQITTAGANLFSWDTAGVTQMILDASGGLWLNGIANFTVAGMRSECSVDNVTNPPSDNEIDSAFGTPATVGDGWFGFINDNNLNNIVWMCVAHNGAWFYRSFTVAT